MQRITKADLDAVLGRYARALAAHELPYVGLALLVGSKYYGDPYSLRLPDGASPVGIPQGYLGFTAREAYNTLMTISVTLEDMAYRNEQL
jgi:hypothetical protein